MKITKTQLKQIIKEEIDRLQVDSNIQKIEDIVYSLPNVTRDNFKLNIQHDPELPGEYKVFHSELAMSKLASLARLPIDEIISMFEDAGFEVGERWSTREPIVLIDPNVSR